MKFKKIVTIGISESSLDADYWNKIDALAEQRVSLLVDSSEIDKHLKDVDCLLVYFNNLINF